MNYSLRRLPLCVLFFVAHLTALQQDPQLKIAPKNEDTLELILTIPVAEQDPLYADSISLSIDHPDISLSAWHPSQEPVQKYDPQFKQQKKLFTGPITITATAARNNAQLSHASLHLMMRTRNQQLHYSFPTQFMDTLEKKKLAGEKASPQKEMPTAQAPNMIETTALPQQSLSFSEKISTLFNDTDSWIIRLLLALLLGVLLSLTPCIYPMIPITVGVLQAQGSRSMGRNFLISLCYIMGVATTFALLGITAALTGTLFGSLMHNPFVIVAIVALLIYLAGSMIGLYELYLPSFLQNSNQNIKGGSLFSTFLFGAVSGTVASPCLSPGLVLLLTVVTALKNILLGFALLFSFGLGLGIPLLIIGTFSSAVNIIPKAGGWMVDIKQFFGFVMLATCFYFLALIVPAYLLSWAFALFCLSVGLFYCKTARKAQSASARLIKTILGISITAVSVYLFFNAYKQSDIRNQSAPSFWFLDYKKALERAKDSRKKMLIDISAPYCSICKAIDNKLFCTQVVCDALAQLIPVKIEDIEADDAGPEIQRRFNILGAPTIILYDPEQDQELRRWGGELYEEEPEQFANQLKD